MFIFQERMRESGMVRVFHVRLLANEVVLVRTEDYVQCIHYARSVLSTSTASLTTREARQQREYELRTLDVFRDDVVESSKYRQTNITKEELFRVLRFPRGDGRGTRGGNAAGTTQSASSSSTSSWDLVKVLMKEGFLVHDEIEENTYRFSIPRSGKVWKYVRDGAREITTKIRRHDYHEMLLR